MFNIGFIETVFPGGGVESCINRNETVRRVAQNVAFHCHFQLPLPSYYSPFVWWCNFPLLRSSFTDLQLVSANDGASTLEKRILREAIGSPFTQIQSNQILPISGIFFGFQGTYTITFWTDNYPLAMNTVTFNSGYFQTTV